MIRHEVFAPLDLLSLKVVSYLQIKLYPLLVGELVDGIFDLIFPIGLAPEFR